VGQLNFSAFTDESLIGRLIRTPLHLIPRRSRVYILQGPLRGTKWIVGSSNHGCWLGSYEHGKQRLFADVLHDGDVVFDVGAHVGFYTLLASSRVGRRGRVFAFEPFRPNLYFLREHLRLNGASNVTVVESAVSETSGVVRFAEGRNTSTAHIAAEGTLQVETVSLDEVFVSQRLSSVAVVKIDVEGAEALVLRGARRLLASQHPAIFLATHGSNMHRECSEILRGLGYNLKPVDGKPLQASEEVLATRHEPGK
jgi:FkbM family methyltransferase